MQVIMYQANAFTDKLFEGSPIGIVPDAKDLSEENMKRIVKVTNLDKIAFAISKEEYCYDLRFFNSEEEIVFCDCATVATFYALADRGYLKGVEEGCVRAYQHTAIGNKPIDIYFKDWKVDRVELCEQKHVVISDDLNLAELSTALNIKESDIGILESDIKPEIMRKDLREMIIPIKSTKALDNIVIDIDRMKANPIMKDIDKLFIFAVDQNEVVNYMCFEFQEKESCASEESTSPLVYFIKKNKLLNKDHFIYKNKSRRSKYNYMHCEIKENKDDFPVKISGRASIYLEGVVTFG